MKRVAFIIAAIFCTCFSATGQCELLDKIGRQAVVIDSLSKGANAHIKSLDQLTKLNRSLQDSLQAMKNDLLKLQEFRTRVKDLDIQIQRKTGSISSFKNSLVEKDKQISTEKHLCDQKLKEVYDKGRNEVIAVIANGYSSVRFDELTRTLHRVSFQRDLELLRNLPELKQLLSDLDIYYRAKELLTVKIDPVLINTYKSQLEQIKRQSESLNILKDLINQYMTYNDGLKELIERLIALDKIEKVSGMGFETQQKKRDKILGHISTYVFSYGFNFTDYPYLSIILVELINRKRPNPDADISDLLKKL